MPDIVNPQSPGFIRLLHGVNTCFFESLLEDRVAESKVRTRTMIESVIARSHVIMSPTQLPGIGSKYADIEARIERSRKEGDGQLVIVWHV